MAFITIILCILIIVSAFFGIIKARISAKSTKEGSTDYGIYGHGFDTETARQIMKFKPIVWGIIGLLVVVFGLFSSIYITSEQEIGFTSTFGQNAPVETAGIHLKAPFISEKHIFDGTTQGMAIGYSLETDESVTEDSLMITSDFNFINIDFYVEYRITDPIAYYYSTDDPEALLQNIALSSIRNTVGQVDVDSAMTTGKSKIEADVFDDITAELLKHQTGISVTNVSIQDAEAPNAYVQNAFQAVEDAKQGAKTAVNEANKYTNEQIPAAEANAAKILADAEATKTERVNQATEEVATFEALYTEYAKNPDVVKQRMYLDTLKDVLPNMEIIIGKDSKVVYVTGSGNVDDIGNVTNSSDVSSNGDNAEN